MKSATTFTITNLLGKPVADVELSLNKIDDYYYTSKADLVSKTNQEGMAKFKSLSTGAYVLRVLSSRIDYEKIIAINSDKIKIRLPILIGLLKTRKEVSKYAVKQIFEQARTDYMFCFKCKRNYHGLVDSHKCKYCKRVFCEDHTIPEKHDCQGSPDSRHIPSSFREGFSRKTGTRVLGK